MQQWYMHFVGGPADGQLNTWEEAKDGELPPWYVIVVPGGQANYRKGVDLGTGLVAPGWDDVQYDYVAGTGLPQDGVWVPKKVGGHVTPE